MRCENVFQANRAQWTFVPSASTSKVKFHGAAPVYIPQPETGVAWKAELIHNAEGYRAGAGAIPAWAGGVFLKQLYQLQLDEILTKNIN